VRWLGAVGVAVVIGLGAWQVAQPTAPGLDGIEMAAQAPLPAPDPSPAIPEGQDDLELPNDLSFGADDEVPVVPRPPTPTTPAPAEPARIVGAPAVADPTSVTIPALGVSAPVDRVALETDGSMEVPHDVARVGWYEPGVRPGETGSAVIAGHVDSRTQGRGALWGLKTLGVGDTVSVGHQDGQTTTWRVTSQTAHVKEQLPIGELFTRFGDRRLVLITCGGSFDAARSRYTHNIVVIAEPVDAAT
jgi:hypothetical protein